MGTFEGPLSGGLVHAVYSPLMTFDVVQKSEVRGSRQRVAPQRLEPLAVVGQTHGQCKQADSRICGGRRHERELYLRKLSFLLVGTLSGFPLEKILLQG